jgi:hypothetical protein
LLGSDATHGHFGIEITLSADWRAGHPAKGCNLSDVRQRIGNWALEEFFRGSMQGLGRGQIFVKTL